MTLPFCTCIEARVFGHHPLCPVRAESWPSCTQSCTNAVCWDRCRAWKAQARVFGWRDWRAIDPAAGAS